MVSAARYTDKNRIAADQHCSEFVGQLFRFFANIDDNFIPPGAERDEDVGECA
jgi:hypothetical protein